ncbi:MAG: hypothetical protein GOVbin1434_22 [Prokaryotic dsDNA virus sp.]|nr:MAG: hypothetical protein GOVbin1434_22 [Prokaryotic dsDNA virus sp.]|tara:strand:- start:700 stop:855 length:156 start_codon:yes stop_codon:yes gene_type:complete
MDIEKELKEQEKTLKLIEGAYYECVGTIKYLKKKLEKLEKEDDSKAEKNTK